MFLSTGSWKWDIVLFLVTSIALIAYGVYLDRKEKK